MRKLVLSTLASLAIAFAMVVNVEPAQAGPKFTLCVEGVCLGKGGVEPRYSDENYGKESGEEFCYDNPDIGGAIHTMSVGIVAVTTMVGIICRTRNITTGESNPRLRGFLIEK